VNGKRQPRAPGADVRIRRVLFLCLFAAQAGSIALAPTLAEVARDFDVSTAMAGQLRTIAGAVAAISALIAGRAVTGAALRRRLVSGSLLLALGSLASAAAPSIAALAAAQIAVGAGIGILTTAATIAAAEWVAPERRVPTLAFALTGQPVAWIVGMPIFGLLAGWSWRWGWLVLPLAAALLAAANLPRCRDDASPAPRANQVPMIAGARRIGRWLAAEALSNVAWAGTLVYSGALLVESYHVSPDAAGVALAIGAGAYVGGNMAIRRIATREPRALLLLFGVALAATTLLFGVLRPSLPASTAIFAGAAFSAGGRTVASGAVAIAAPPELRSLAMALRAASIQFGYFGGSLIAGIALAFGGYNAVGAALGTIFLVGAFVVAPPRIRREDAFTRRSTGVAPS
jgi:DHA1 family inner membrane transport protein